MHWKRMVVGLVTIWLGLQLCNFAHEATAATSNHPSKPPSIDAIRELAELTVLEVEVTDVVTAEISGYTGGTTVDMLIRGTATIGVDLQQAKFVEVDEERRHIVLALPPPEVRRVSIDHEASRVLSCRRSGLWLMAAGDALEDQAIREALVIGQERLSLAASRDDLIQRAETHTENLIRNASSDMGWVITTRWQE